MFTSHTGTKAAMIYACHYDIYLMFKTQAVCNKVKHETYS